MARRRVQTVFEPKARLIHGDNLKALQKLAREQQTPITLTYLDPPFMTQRNYFLEDGRHAFDDRWSSRKAYLAALAVPLTHLRGISTLDASVVIHTDSKMGHHVKVMADGVFGFEAFASEIVWRYRRWPSRTPNFQRVHDTLLRYLVYPDNEPRWNQLYEPLAPSTVETWGTAKQQALFDDEGRRIKSSTLDEPSKGVPMGDVWDIGIIAPVSKERNGYPSQKPIALMQRLIEALSRPGDTVLDPYCGSGSFLEAAVRMGRSAIGIDSSKTAIDIARARLKDYLDD